ncbi:NACHT domain-containing protein [Streptomyces sp. NPDC001975]
MRRVPKWVGLLYAALIMAFLAWYITRGHPVGDLGTLVSTFTGLLALPAAVIAVLRPGKNVLAPARLEDMADQLAQAMRQQWEAEAKVRRLNDPFPLSVEWDAADAALVESWPHLRELAGDWPGQSPANSLWADSPKGLAGKGGEIAQVFERVPTRRLVVLGEPGTGKTMLLIRLLLALLERRPPGGPVPVLFSLASWDPARQDLYAWMADQLARDHPALHAPANPPQPSPSTQASALLEQRLILPILDGLDELPDAVRARALHAINEVLPAGQPLVLSSRTAEFRRTLTPPAGTTMLLNGAAGICLLPLDPAKAGAYLERDAGGPGTQAAARWNRVTASLGTNVPASQALSTPLGLFLARTIYTPRLSEDPTRLPDPDELLDQSRFPTREDVDAHLFSAFIPAAYRPHPHHPSSWSPEKAQRILVFLAHHLQHNLDGTPDLAWWQLHKALPKRMPALVIGLVSMLLYWILGLLQIAVTLAFRSLSLADLPLSRSTALVVQLLFTFGLGVVTAWLSSTTQDKGPRSGICWSRRGYAWFAAGLLLGFVAWFATGLMYGFRAAIPFGLFVGLTLGPGFGLLAGLTSAQPDLAKAVGPRAVLARDRNTFWIITLVGGAAVGIVFGITFGFWMARAYLFWGGFVAGLFAGLAIGSWSGLSKAVWAVYLVARISLAMRRRVPWRLMGFLADAHEQRGVLRQAGAVYQFRHLDLQRHLAEHRP